MNLVLSAVFAANDPTKGLAIIGESRAVSEGLRGRRSGAAGHEAACRLPRPRHPGSQRPARSAVAAEAEHRGHRHHASARRLRPASNQFAENLRRIAETNPSAFAEIVRPQPVFANGVQRGYRVYPGRNRQQFAKLGLQPGDLVLSINGTPLDDPQRGMEIFNTIGTSDRVTVTVERNGQSQELTLNTAQITLPDAERADRRQTGQQPADTRRSAATPSAE